MHFAILFYTCYNFYLELSFVFPEIFLIVYLLSVNFSPSTANPGSQSLTISHCGAGCGFQKKLNWDLARSKEVFWEFMLKVSGLWNYLVLFVLSKIIGGGVDNYKIDRGGVAPSPNLYIDQKQCHFSPEQYYYLEWGWNTLSLYTKLSLQIMMG